MKHVTQFYHIIAAVTLTVLLALLIIPHIVAPNYASQQLGNMPEEFPFAWSEVGNDRVFSPPTVVNSPKKRITITNTIPEGFGNNSPSQICITTNHSDIVVKVGDTVIRSLKPENYIFGRHYGLRYNIINLPPRCAGKPIYITYFANTNKIQLYNILIAEKNLIFFRLILDNLPNILFSLIMIVISLLLIVLFFMFGTISKKYKNKLLLDLFLSSLVSVFWVISDMPITALFLKNSTLVYLLSCASFLLMPIPLLIISSHLFPSIKTICSWLANIFVISFIVQTALQLANIVSFSDSIIVNHILIVLTVLTFIICIAKNRRSSDLTENKITVIGFFLMLAASTTDVIKYYMYSKMTITYYFQISLILFIVMLSFSTYKKLLELYNEENKLAFYKELAFRDESTSLKNRNAFRNELDVIKNSSTAYNSVAMIIIDINNLKLINDTYGHYIGDVIINAFARILKDSCSYKYDSYRIGGDEFVIIVKNDSEEEINKLIDKISAETDEYNKDRNIRLSYSYGCASQPPNESGCFDLDALYKSADERMYSMKKAGPSR